MTGESFLRKSFPMDEGENGGENKIGTEKRETFQTRWFFVVFFVIVLLSVFATFYRVFIARNYSVMIETVCYPETESCFARGICDTEDQVCMEGDTPVETSFYKTVERKAYAFPNECASGSMDSPACIDLSCRARESDCTETLCAEGLAPEGETCVGPGFVSKEPVIQSEEGEEEAGDENEEV